MNRTALLKKLRYWPPYLGMGVRVTYASPDMHVVEVEMRMRFWNRNVFGTHFGGSLYAMVDPFFVLMLLEILGREYIIWDKSAAIRFKHPGRGTVRARFELTPAQVAEIKRAAGSGERAHPELHASVVDAAGVTVAEVDKVLSVRLRRVD